MTKRRFRGTVAGATLLLLLGGSIIGSAKAKDTEKQDAAAAVSVLSTDLKTGWTLNAPKGFATPLAVVPVAGQPFTTAFRIQTLRRADHDYDIQLVAPTIVPIAKGDVCVFSCYVRGKPANGKNSGAFVQAMFERFQAPPDNSLRVPRIVGDVWARIELPFVAAADFAAGEAKFNFRLGYLPETVEVGEPRLVNYGKTKTLADLPRTPITYPGQEPNAPWRKAALARIETLRKADLTVRIVDAKGKPVRGVKVGAQLTRNAFPIGTAVTDQFISGPKADTPDGKRWREEFSKHFTAATAGILTWRWWELPETKTMDFATLDWLDAQNIKTIHGAHLVWTWWDRLPPDVVTKYRADAKTAPTQASRDLQTATLTHIDAKLNALKGRLTSWNGVNEVTENREMADAAGGIPAMVEWFKTARTIEPNVPFIVNDYDMLTKWGINTLHLDDYYNLIKGLQDGGAPVGGIGFQSHFLSQLTAPERVLEILDRFAKLGVPLHITEFDLTMNSPTDRNTQADYTRDFLLLTYSHPAIASFTMWGFRDDDTYHAEAPLFYKDWTLKPSGKAFLGLTEGAWKTNASGVTNAKGTFTTHGTLGKYSVTATASDGRTITQTTEMTRKGQTLTLRLPEKKQ